MAMGLPWQEVVAIRTPRCFHPQPLPATPSGSLGPLNVLLQSAALSPPWYLSGPSVLLSTFCTPLPPSLPHPTPLSSFLLPAFSPLPMPPSSYPSFSFLPSSSPLIHLPRQLSPRSRHIAYCQPASPAIPACRSFWTIVMECFLHTDLTAHTQESHSWWGHSSLTARRSHHPSHTGRVSPAPAFLDVPKWGHWHLE